MVKFLAGVFWKLITESQWDIDLFLVYHPLDRTVKEIALRHPNILGKGGNRMETESLTAVCKLCQSKNVRKFGMYKDTQLYFCNYCKRKFIPNASLFHMKAPANQVSSAIDMYYKGLSINEIREYLQQEYGNTPSDSTVFAWIDKFTNEAVKQADQYHLPKLAIRG